MSVERLPMFTEGILFWHNSKLSIQRQQAADEATQKERQRCLGCANAKVVQKVREIAQNLCSISNDPRAKSHNTAVLQLMNFK